MNNQTHEELVLSIAERFATVFNAQMIQAWESLGIEPLSNGRPIEQFIPQAEITAQLMSETWDKGHASGMENHQFMWGEYYHYYDRDEEDKKALGLVKE